MSSSSQSNPTNALSFAFRLVDDVLIRVFNIVLLEELWQKYDTDPRREGFSPLARHPWTPAAVCKHWRAVCLQFATLWSYIQLPGQHRSDSLSANIQPEANSFLLERVLLQLERSQKALLIIHIDFVCDCTNHVARWRAALLHSERWRGLYLQTGSGWYKISYFQDMVSNTDASFPHLERLHIMDGTAGTVEFSSAKCGTFLMNLRSVIVTGIGDLRMDLAGLPWHRLTSLTFERYGIEGGLTSLIKVLSKCISLHHFSLSTNSDYGGYETVDVISKEIPKDSVTIPHLLSLAFIDTGSLNYVEKRILPFLRLPSLKYLFYGSIDYESDDPDDGGPISCDTLIDLIVRSGCALKELALQLSGSLDSPSKSPAELLTLLPQLRYIDIHFGCDANLLREVLLPADHEFLCPSLEYLRIDWRRGYFQCNAELDHTINVLKSRLNSPTHFAIKTLHITTYRYICSDTQRNMIEKGLEEHTKNGLNIQFDISNHIKGHYQEEEMISVLKSRLNVSVIKTLAGSNQPLAGGTFVGKLR